MSSTFTQSLSISAARPPVSSRNRPQAPPKTARPRCSAHMRKQRRVRSEGDRCGVWHCTTQRLPAASFEKCAWLCPGWVEQCPPLIRAIIQWEVGENSRVQSGAVTQRDPLKAWTDLGAEDAKIIKKVRLYKGDKKSNWGDETCWWRKDKSLSAGLLRQRWRQRPYQGPRLPEEVGWLPNATY